MLRVIELKVHVHCKGCEKIVRKALCRIKGVRCVDINVRMNKIIVLGHLNDTNVIVKALRKTGRRAEVLPSSYSGRSEEPPMRTGFRCLLPIKLLKKL